MQEVWNFFVIDQCSDEKLSYISMKLNDISIKYPVNIVVKMLIEKKKLVKKKKVVLDVIRFPLIRLLYVFSVVPWKVPDYNGFFEPRNPKKKL